MPYLCMPWITKIFHFDIPFESPQGVAVAVFFGVWRPWRHTPLSCLSIERRFYLFSPPFSALHFGCFAAFGSFPAFSSTSPNRADSAARNGRNTLFTPPCLRRHCRHYPQCCKIFPPFFCRCSENLKSKRRSPQANIETLSSAV